MAAGTASRLVHWNFLHASGRSRTVVNPVAIAISRYFLFRRRHWREALMALLLAGASISAWLFLLEKLR